MGAPRWLLFFGILFLPGAAAGQPPAGPPPEAPLVTSAKSVMNLFGKPVHPVVKSVAPAGGPGAGIGYKTTHLWSERGFASTNAVYTIHKYWNVEANLGVQENHFRVQGFARARDLTRLPFYGLGYDASRQNNATFRYLDRSIGGNGSIRYGWIGFAGRLESLWPTVDPRSGIFDAPGLAEQPRFTHIDGAVNFNYPSDLNSRGWTGGDLQIAYGAFHDASLGRYSFRRLNIEAQQRLPGATQSQRLTLHGWFNANTAVAGNAVPFYLQPTLGGAGFVRGVDEEIIGSDASKATLRGFQDLRFRGPHLILLQAEYRLKAWGPIDVSGFVDAGKAVTRRADLDLRHLRHDYGFSTSIMTGEATALRLDVGFGGGEGVHAFVTIGPIFAQ